MDLHGDVPRLRHHPARRRPAGGAQPLRRRQADDRPAARRARRRLHRGRLAGREPQGHRVLPPRGRRARPAARQARGVRRHPAGRRARPPTTRRSPRCATAAPRVVTLVAKSHDRHVELALRTTLEENLAMVRDTVSHLRGGGPAGLPRRRALLRRLPRQPRLRARGAAHGVRGRRRGGRALRHQRRDAARTGSPTSCTTSIETTGVRVGIHAHNDSGCAVANTLAAVDAGATHVQGSINGYGERTGNADLVSVVANLELKLDRAVLPPGLLARGDPDRARRRRGHQLPARLAPAVRRHLGVRAQGRAARQRDQGRPEPLPAHSTRSASATTCGCWSPTWPAARRSSSRAASSASTCPATGAGHPGHRPGQGAGGDAATRSRPPTRRSSCCWSRRSRARRPSYFEVESWRVITETLDHRGRRGGRLRGDREAARPRACATS